MENLENSSPFWKKTGGLQKRIQQVSKYRDNTTNTDEILIWANRILFVLLLFTAGIAAFSYTKTFSFLPRAIAFIAAVVLSAAIEFGKNFCARYAIRLPFFMGFNFIFASAARTFMWGALTLVGAGMFYVSFVNSTKGAEAVSLMMSKEKASGSETFVPDTKTVDTEIAATEARIARNNQNAWKGVTTITSQRANREETKTLRSLQVRKDTLISQQLSAFRALQANQASTANTAAKVVLESGGWVECLQVLLLLLCVASEKILSEKMRQNEIQQEAFRSPRQ